MIVPRFKTWKNWNPVQSFCIDQQANDMIDIYRYRTCKASIFVKPFWNFKYCQNLCLSKSGQLLLKPVTLHLDTNFTTVMQHALMKSAQMKIFAMFSQSVTFRDYPSTTLQPGCVCLLKKIEIQSTVTIQPRVLFLKRICRKRGQEYPNCTKRPRVLWSFGTARHFSLVTGNSGPWVQKSGYQLTSKNDLVEAL